MTYLNAKLCCECVPLIHIDFSKQARNRQDDVYLQCPVCGKRTDCVSMSWIAYDLWNKDFVSVPVEQLSFFER